HNGLAHALIELRQDEISEAQGVQLWGARLVALLEQAVQDPEMTQPRNYGSCCDA
ncbi:MAG TPA: N-formylglutamate amidohydrolase, partial [Rhodobiaceae bacterium]|nr:N-formylglutamate amidohydrolase [Rhodobiaceae bacterium]